MSHMYDEIQDELVKLEKAKEDVRHSRKSHRLAVFKRLHRLENHLKASAKQAAKLKGVLQL